MLGENAMTGEIVLRVEELSHRYGENRGVDAVSFTLSRGQVLGFLGPNGAGKSTTLRMLAGVLAPDAGRIIINGADLLDQPQRAKQAIGYLPEQPPLYRELTVDEQLHYSARLHRLDRAASRQAMTRGKERCGLMEVSRRLIGNLSKGYRQRVGIAQAMLHDPPVLILDEPTVGLDPIQGREIRDLIRELGQDRGVILSTHLLAEVQTTCNQVQIMQSGRLVYNGALADLHQQQHQSSRLRIGLNAPPPATELARLPAVMRVEDLGGGQFRLHHAVGAAPHQALIKHAQAGGWDLWEMTPEAAGLEQICIELMLGQEAVA
ncbi:ABC transporter related protein [Candidatus Contendobacter odensis Run_B_J11]|uniref:ABC transporter related protein n=2 Tax=Candidatus Contendibacter odensensis TaxID=1400860 RepID=A0A7U7J686_9GAMM|nr:ABC transporter related protein [Candidatus Contendobacter odensis Run_B_J11]